MVLRAECDAYWRYGYLMIYRIGATVYCGIWNERTSIIHYPDLKTAQDKYTEIVDKNLEEVFDVISEVIGSCDPDKIQAFYDFTIDLQDKGKLEPENLHLDLDL